MSLDSLIEKSKNIKFEKTVSRPLPPFHADLLVTPITNEKLYSPIIGCNFSYENEVCISGDFYDDLDVLNREEQIIYETSQKDINYLAQKATYAEELGTDLITYCQNVSKTDVNKLSDTQLIRILKIYTKKASAFVPYFTFTISTGNLLEKIIEKQIVKLVKDVNKSKELTIKVTNPDRVNKHMEEQLDLLKIAQRKFENKNIDSEIDRHVQKYGYIGFRDGVGNFWTEREISERIKNIDNPKGDYNKLIKNQKEIKEEFVKLTRKLRFDKNILNLINTAKSYVWLRTYRSDTYSHAFALISKFLLEFSNNEGYKDEDYLLLTPTDINAGKLPTKEELKKRKVSFAVICIDKKIYRLSGKESLQYQKFLDSKNLQTNTIKGTTANKPVNLLTGTVKIVITPNDLSKINEGDIIVSTMTTPNFVVAMNRAGGFVTDEGGILCHAAILSREMNKPCIVGTKNATQLLKDGDVIQMDMKGGIVNKVY